MTKNLADNVRSLRVLRNLSQEYLAEATGLSQSAYGKLERGETRITVQRLCDIARILQVSPQEIDEFDPGEMTDIGLLSYPPRLINGQKKFHRRQIAALETKITYLKQMNQILRQQLQDKEDIIELLMKRNS